MKTTPLPTTQWIPNSKPLPPPPTTQWLPNSRQQQTYSSAGLPRDNQRKTTDPLVHEYIAKWGTP